MHVYNKTHVLLSTPYYMFRPLLRRLQTELNHMPKTIVTSVLIVVHTFYCICEFCTYIQHKITQYTGSALISDNVFGSPAIQIRQLEHSSLPALIRRCDDLPATITHVPVAAVLVLNTPDDGRLRPKHVE